MATDALTDDPHQVGAYAMRPPAQGMATATLREYVTGGLEELQRIIAIPQNQATVMEFD